MEKHNDICIYIYRERERENYRTIIETNRHLINVVVSANMGLTPQMTIKAAGNYLNFGIRTMCNS